MIESNFLICQFRRNAISINNKIFKLQITSSRKISKETDFENYEGAYDWRDDGFFALHKAMKKLIFKQVRCHKYFNILTFKIFIGTEIS